MKNQNPHQHNRNLLKEITPQFRFDGSIPLEQWKDKAYQTLYELLGLPSFQKCDADFAVEYEKELDNTKEVRFTFQSEEGYYVPCHLLIPKDADKRPLPVVICLQGHSTGMHISLGRAKYEGDEQSISGGDRDFAIRAVREGYCALTIEQRNFGENGGTPQGPDCHNSSMTALLMGRTTIGERVWDVSRAIDVLEKHFPQVDQKQIICMGNSGGGTATYYAACMEERIHAVMPSCAVCTFDDSIAAMHHCTCNYVPHIRNFFEMGDMAGLIAPRKLVVVAGKEDPIFPISGVYETFEIIKRFYKHLQAEENCALVVGDGGHRFYADQSWAVMNAMLGHV